MLRLPGGSFVVSISENKMVRRFGRTIRLMAAATGVYTIGYTSGLHDFIRSPRETSKNLVKQALTEVDASRSEFHHHLTSRNATPEYQKVAAIVKRLIPAAKQVVNAMLKEELAKPKRDQDHGRIRALKSSQKLMKEDFELIMYDAQHPNAFVYGLLPRYIFVARSMVCVPGNTSNQPGTLCHTDEELAMVIGHEMAHTILDHIGSSLEVMKFASLFKIFMLAVLDPLGISSLLMEWSLEPLSKYLLVLTEKRANENEADETGLRIVSTACFDPRKAVKFFDRLYNMEEEVLHSHHRSWNSDHPATEERQLAMKDSLSQAVALYEGNNCAPVRHLMAASERGWFGRLGGALYSPAK